MLESNLNFIDFLIDLFACEKRIAGPILEGILEALDWVSLIFSCLFMLELLASAWAFGPKYVSRPNGCIKTHDLADTFDHGFTCLMHS